MYLGTETMTAEIHDTIVILVKIHWCFSHECRLYVNTGSGTEQATPHCPENADPLAVAYMPLKRKLKIVYLT